jgi:hypothetical protein
MNYKTKPLFEMSGEERLNVNAGELFDKARWQNGIMNWRGCLKSLRVTL